MLLSLDFINLKCAEMLTSDMGRAEDHFGYKVFFRVFMLSWDDDSVAGFVLAFPLIESLPSIGCLIGAGEPAFTFNKGSCFNVSMAPRMQDMTGDIQKFQSWVWDARTKVLDHLAAKNANGGIPV